MPLLEMNRISKILLALLVLYLLGSSVLYSIGYRKGINVGSYDKLKRQQTLDKKKTLECQIKANQLENYIKELTQ